MINERDIIILLYIFLFISLWINITLMTVLLYVLFFLINICYRNSLKKKVQLYLIIVYNFKSISGAVT